MYLVVRKGVPFGHKSMEAPPGAKRINTLIIEILNGFFGVINVRHKAALSQISRKLRLQKQKN